MQQVCGVGDFREYDDFPDAEIFVFSRGNVPVPYEYWEQGRSICKPSHLTYGEIRTNESS